MVIKRNGNKVPYDIEKIKIAVSKAYKEVRPDISDECVRDRAAKVSDLVDRIISNKSEDISVEDIQDIVEDVLIGIDNDVAKAYIKYRYKRQMARNTTDNAIMELIGGKSEYWNTENSNKNANIVTTQRDYLAGITSKDITKRFLLPEHIVKADEDGIIHFHDSDYFIQNITNCFHGSTKFVTSEGVRKFDSCYDGEVVKVVDKNGEWKTATVHNYGKQKMQTVTLQSGRSVVKVRCTPNHRWLLKNGSVTTDLKIDDRLALTPYQHNITEINPKMFCLGFVLGDGSDYSKGNSEGVRVRLCGNKTSYLDLFIEAGYKISSVTFDNNDVVCIKNGHSFKNSFIKNHMWRCLTHEDLYSLFEGYYAADGSKDRCAISTADSDLAMMIDEISSITGRYIISRRTNTTPTNFSDNRILYEFRFIKNTLPNRNWIVKDIDKSDLHEYSAWCVEEPTTNSFTLDSGIVTGNCCLVNLDDMLQNGTVINKKMIEKPHRFLTASTIATQIITAVASSQYGGTSIDISHLAPFVRDSFNYHKNKYIERGFDDEDAYIFALQDTQKEVEDGVQTFNYQINSMSTTNGQTPFISVFLYLGDNPEYEEETAMIISEFLRQRIKGIKNEEGIYITQEFPKLLYVIEESNCMNGGKYDHLTELAAQCTAKRLVPDYISKKKMIEYKDGDVYGCMGCRSFLTVDRFTEKYGNISKSKNYKPNEHKYWGRFNQGVVTISLPDVAFSSGGDMDKFWRLMDERTELCHEALRLRHERLKGTLSDVAPILWQHGAFARLGKGEKIDELLYHGYSTISLGYAGLYECVKYMTGFSHTDESVGEEFGLKVMQYLNDKCNKWKSEEDIDYSPYGSPIESTTYKFAKCLKNRFGDDIFIKLDGKDRNYITNSYHVPVFEEINPFKKLFIESKFQKLSTGGAVSYIEASNLENNTDAIIEVIKFIYDNILYAEINTKSDYCMACGYDKEIKIIDENGHLDWECPQCKNRDHDKMSVARRTCGYVGGNFWNQGRTDEINNRYVHLDCHEYKE